MRRKEAMRERILSEWRVLPRPRKTRPTRGIADVVPEAMKKLGLEDAFQEEEVLKAWAGIVGEFISGNTRPSGMKKKVLEVSVLQPAVHFTLEREMKPDVLRRLQEVFGADKIRDVRFRLG